MSASDISDAVVGHIYRTHRSAVLSYVRKNFGAGPPDPEDVVQTIFERYIGQADKQKIDNPRAFLLSSARNFVIDQRRRAAVQTDFVQESQSTGDQSDDLNACRVMEAKQALDLLQEAITSLKPRTREMLLMSRLHGLSSAEIARQMNCSPTLVKKLIAQALVACHRAIDGDE